MQLSRPRAQGEGGFTLVELLVTIVVLGMVGSIVTSSLVGGMQATRRAEARVEALTDLQRAAERASRELRAACPVTDVDPDDPDSATPDGDEGHHVQVEVLRGGERRRFTYDLPVGSTSVEVREERFDTATSSWVTTRAGVLITGIDNRTGSPALATFRALDQDGQVTTVAQQVVSFELTLRRTLSDGPPITADHVVHVRNGGRRCG